MVEDLDNLKFWQKFAKNYDRFMRRRLPYYDKVIERIIHDIGSCERILEVATGTGLIALEIAKSGLRIDAIDISSKMIEEAQKKAHHEGLENINFSVQSAYHLDFDQDLFDAAICANALHVMEHPGKALTEIRRVLKPRGKLIAPTYCHGQSVKTRIISGFMGIAGFKAYEKYSIDGFKQFVEDNGYRICSERLFDDAIPLCYVAAISC